MSVPHQTRTYMNDWHIANDVIISAAVARIESTRKNIAWAVTVAITKPVVRAALHACRQFKDC